MISNEYDLFQRVWIGGVDQGGWIRGMERLCVLCVQDMDLDISGPHSTV